MFKFNHIRFILQAMYFAVDIAIWRLSHFKGRSTTHTWRYNFYDHVAGLSWHYDGAFSGFDRWTQKRMHEMNAS